MKDIDNVAGLLRSLARNIERGNVKVDYCRGEGIEDIGRIEMQFTGSPSLQLEDLAEMMQEAP